MRNLVRKILITIALILLVGCTKATTRMKKGSVDQKNYNTNPKSVIGYVGDVMPFYDNGVMNVYYLQDGRNTYLGFHPFALMTTTDYVTYRDYGEVINYDNDLYSQDLALGTGTIIKDKNGLYHCFYTGHNGSSQSGLPYHEKIQHATSLDKVRWVKVEKDGFYGGSNDFRDPYVYYMEEDSMWHMIVTTRDGNTGVLKEYTSSDLSRWTYKGIFFRNDVGTYNMECPTFIYYNGYYYLSFSEQGNNRVTHYRYKKNLNDEWIRPEIDYFDSEGFYAGRMEKDEEKLYIFGWCATKTGEYDLGDFDWAGNLVVHELYQLENGELRPRMVSNYKTTFNNEVEYSYIDGNPVKDMSFDSSETKSLAVEKLSRNITRISFALEVGDDAGNCGLSFDTMANHILGSMMVSFDIKNDKVRFYNNVKGFSQYGTPQLNVTFDFERGESYDVDILIDGEILTMYVNDTIALSTRMYYMVESGFSFYSNGANVSFKGVSFYE